jgi:sugar phosphate isomerase/epimerase
MIPACHCGAESVVLFPGTDAERSDLFDFALARPVADLAFCLPHAKERGWPNLQQERSGRHAG